jgi:hypothetical protein
VPPHVDPARDIWDVVEVNYSECDVKFGLRIYQASVLNISMVPTFRFFGTRTVSIVAM